MVDQILGWSATFLFTVMYIPQIIKTIKIKSVHDISLSMYVMGFIANIIALIYSCLIKQLPLQIKYCMALLVLGFYLLIYFKIRMKNDN